MNNFGAKPMLKANEEILFDGFISLLSLWKRFMSGIVLIVLGIMTVASGFEYFSLAIIVGMAIIVSVFSHGFTSEIIITNDRIFLTEGSLISKTYILTIKESEMRFVNSMIDSAIGYRRVKILSNKGTMKFAVNRKSSGRLLNSFFTAKYIK